jgi:hypothetical protein
MPNKEEGAAYILVGLKYGPDVVWFNALVWGPHRHWRFDKGASISCLFKPSFNMYVDVLLMLRLPL